MTATRGPVVDPWNPNIVVGPDLKSNVDMPVSAAAYSQLKTYPISPPPAPCQPSVAASNPGNGFSQLTISRGCPPVVEPIRIFRAEGSAGPMALLADIGTASVYTDRTTLPGKTYRYMAKAYNSANVESTGSSQVSVTVTDTTPPSVPGGVTGTPGPHSATLSWGHVPDRDALGYNAYMSTTSGGPYTKLNGSPITTPNTPQWTATGLNNGQSYYFVVKSVDFKGNESGPSAQVSVTPG